MQAQEFVRKWQAGGAANELNERAGAQAHFIDLCRVLGVPEPGDPKQYCFERGVAKTGCKKDLAKRTLTNLYNQRATWLAQTHTALDAAVAAAYGWADYTPALPDEEILRRLLALNLARAG